MKKTYVTSMPNHIGAFLKASKCFSALGINITRVSYNKAVDSHTLFIDAEGTEEQLKKADAEPQIFDWHQRHMNFTLDKCPMLRQIYDQLFRDLYEVILGKVLLLVFDERADIA